MTTPTFRHLPFYPLILSNASLIICNTHRSLVSSQCNTEKLGGARGTRLGEEDIDNMVASSCSCYLSASVEGPGVRIMFSLGDLITIKWTVYQIKVLKGGGVAYRQISKLKRPIDSFLSP